MSLDKYKQRTTPSPVERFYEVFLQNAFAHQKFKITLVDGISYVGVPTAPSFFNPFDPDASFMFTTDEGRYRIPFRDLKDAEVLEG